MTALTLDTLNRSSQAEFTAALGDVFEHSPWVADAAWATRPFASLEALYTALTATVLQSSRDWQLALIEAHPDLAGKAAADGDLTAASAAEQSSAGLDRLSEAELAAFRRLNDAYRARFHFPFILCVRRHTRDSILRQFERRLANDPERERRTALEEICRIAALRLDQRVSASPPLKVHGRLSTHVLDTHGGSPAAGVAVELMELAEAAPPRLVTRAVTNSDGRTEPPLITGRPLPIGRYELRFAVGPYFVARGVAAADPEFLDIVPVRFGIAEAEGNYHVPLLMTPWSYSTYRGS